MGDPNRGVLFDYYVKPTLVDLHFVVRGLSVITSIHIALTLTSPKCTIQRVTGDPNNYY
jgi:hypothetical protein